MMDPVSSISPIARSAEVQRLNPTTTTKPGEGKTGSFSTLVNSYLSNTKCGSGCLGPSRERPGHRQNRQYPRRRDGRGQCRNVVSIIHGNQK